MSKTAGGFAIVLTTAGSEDEASSIATALVEKRLAACVNIIPGVASVYRWKGALCNDSERLLIVKTTVAAFPKVREAIRAMHSYEVPEVLMLRVVEGEPDYLAWLTASLEGRDEESEGGPPL